ncbi:acyl-CoA thioesterase II, partial [Mesorhizobium sp. M7A.F.Ca.CA.001.13.2.1]
MTAAMDELLGILDLEKLEHNLYRGRSPLLDWQRVFGGQT